MDIWVKGYEDHLKFSNGKRIELTDIVIISTGPIPDEAIENYWEPLNPNYPYRIVIGCNDPKKDMILSYADKKNCDKDADLMGKHWINRKI